jgi:quercetin dioxygenase-like cupin family protein
MKYQRDKSAAAVNTKKVSNRMRYVSRRALRSGKMREFRYYELDRRDVPTGWFIDRPQTLKVTHGQLWVTVEGEGGDIWLRAGESLELQPYSTIWVSAAEEGGRFSMASVSAPRKHWVERVIAWFARRPSATRAMAS